MKPVDVKPSTYIDSSKKINNKDTKFKIGDVARISHYKSFFAKVYVPNWSEDEEIVGTFYVKELEKTNQEQCRLEKVIKRKGNKLYVKWEGYGDSFNSWIDKKDIV